MHHVAQLRLPYEEGLQQRLLAELEVRQHPQFLDGAFEAVFQGTGGVPRRINAVCDRLLLSGFLAGKHELSRADVEAVTHEIHDETHDAAAAADGDAAPSADEIAQETARRPRGGAAGRIDGRALDDAAKLLARAQSDPIEERLTRIENRTNAIVALLEQLLDALRPQTPKKSKSSHEP